MSAERARPVGMAVFLASWAMLLFALLYAAAMLRSRGAWEPLGAATGAGLPLLATALIVASSLALVPWNRNTGTPRGPAHALAALPLLERGGTLPASRRLASTRADLPSLHRYLGSRGLVRSTVLAAALGAAFLAVQLAVWSRAAAAGATGRQVLALLAGFHALHAAIGVVALALLAARRRPPGMWSIYWHAVAAAWLAIGALLFL